ncbi:ABC transporter substrate-binding protein (plasmid) [Geobacillus stearothermophilus]|nr:ABC transporter substrate-binding protein [Geobacillus stearothermophilus]
MKKSHIFFPLLVIFILILSACSSGSTDVGTDGGNKGKDDGKLVVGFSQMENNNPWRIAETESIRNEAKKRGIELVYTDAQGDTAKQVSDVEDMIAKGVDYIVLAPREYDGLAPALQAAKKANIPVILVDRKAKGTPGEDYVTFIGSNFIEEGQRAAEWLIKELGGKGNIVELTGTSGSSVALDRQKGFSDTIKQKAPDMKIIASQTGDFARAEGQKVMENLLQSYGDQIDAVYAHNDEMAIGAINAIKAAGKVPGKDIIIVSVDGTKDALKAIIAGELGATVECSPFFGPIVFDVIEKLENGEEVPTEIINKDRFFDKSNAEQYVDEAY